jgi:hypothetical protein
MKVTPDDLDARLRALTDQRGARVRFRVATICDSGKIDRCQLKVKDMKQRAIDRKLAFAAVVVAAAFSVRCGGSSSGNDASGAGGQGTITMLNDAGSGVLCGAKTCTLPSYVTTGSACCISALDGKCGVETPGAFGAPASCGPVPAPPNMNCPAATIGGGFITFTGCCTSAGQCGQSNAMFSPTCTDNATFEAGTQMFGGMGGAVPGFDAAALPPVMITVPPPSSCSP